MWKPWFLMNQILGFISTFGCCSVLFITIQTFLIFTFFLLTGSRSGHGLHACRSLHLFRRHLCRMPSMSHYLSPGAEITSPLSLFVDLLINFTVYFDQYYLFFFYSQLQRSLFLYESCLCRKYIFEFDTTFIAQALI